MPSRPCVRADGHRDGHLIFRPADYSRRRWTTSGSRCSSVGCSCCWPWSPALPVAGGPHRGRGGAAVPGGRGAGAGPARAGLQRDRVRRTRRRHRRRGRRGSRADDADAGCGKRRRAGTRVTSMIVAGFGRGRAARWCTPRHRPAGHRAGRWSWRAGPVSSSAAGPGLRARRGGRHGCRADGHACADVIADGAVEAAGGRPHAGPGRSPRTRAASRSSPASWWPWPWWPP